MSMTSLDRVFTALGHKEPDRVPLILPLTLHGAKELGMGIREYYGRPEHVIQGQLALREKYGHDCLIASTYGAAEYEAFGGQAVFFDDGPPNAGDPVIKRREDIFSLRVPDIDANPILQGGLTLTRGLVEAARGEVPVMGVVVSPFSIPVMLMGFAAYLDLMHDDPEGFERLMQITRAFAERWANAQFAAGATAVTYYDPLSASDISSDELFERYGQPIARETLARFKGPGGLHFASGRARGRVDAYIATGAAALGVSCLDDLADLKRQCAGRVALMGNLNGLAMIRWTQAEATDAVRACIQQAAHGGGFALSDAHGEIPFYVPDDTIHAIIEATKQHGTYPLEDA